MHRSISLLGFCALLLTPAVASASCGQSMCSLPITLATASGGVSGTGGYNDTGASGSVSGSENSMPDNATTTNGNATASGNTSTHKKHKNHNNASGTNNGTNGDTTNGTMNMQNSPAPGTGGAYNNGPAGVAAPHQ